MKNKKKCSCDGTGQIVVCLLCRDNIPHGSCDDSYSVPCQCQKNKNILKGGLEKGKDKITEEKCNSSSIMNKDSFNIPIFRVSRNYGEPNGVETICHLASRLFDANNHVGDLRNSFIEGASSRIEKIFDEFLDTHPDSDSQFTNYVQENSNEFYALEMNNIVDVVL